MNIYAKIIGVFTNLIYNEEGLSKAKSIFNDFKFGEILKNIQFHEQEPEEKSYVIDTL